MMLKTKYDGEELTHRLLWHIVEEHARMASERVEGFFYPILVCEVFAFHTIEAYINFIGERIAPEIWTDERNYFRREPYRGWNGKIRKILDLLDLNYDPDKPPMSTVSELRKIRDLIAHGRPETFADEVTHLPADHPSILPPSALRTAVAEREALPMILTEVEGFLDAIHFRAAPKVQERLGRTDRALWFGDRALRGPVKYGGAVTTPHRSGRD